MKERDSMRAGVMVNMWLFSELQVLPSMCKVTVTLLCVVHGIFRSYIMIKYFKISILLYFLSCEKEEEDRNARSFALDK